MLDIKVIRNDSEAIEKKVRAKDPEASVEQVIFLDKKLRHAKTEVEMLKSQRNEASKKIGQLKREGKDATDILHEVEGISSTIHTLDKEIKELETAFTAEISKLPNPAMDDVKVSHDISENVVLKEYGTKPSFDFPFKNHLELNEKLDLFDFARGAKISGSGWPLYKHIGARLEWALISYLLEINIKNGFQQWIPPLLVRPETMFGAGQLPKFEHQLFKLTDENFQLYLIPTAEAALNGLHSDEILSEEDLPLKYVAYSPCFRREAGAAGSTERGLIRVHQFNKVEMFCFTTPEESAATFDLMMDNAEEILQTLGLHYRNVLLVTGDTSFCSARTVDIEVWLPGQDRYYEVSSVSNCTDFQARRSKTRFRRKDSKPELIHTLNGSGLATSRLMVAILENNQQPDGSVIIPEVLRKYLGGMEKITP
jgi:seryl-tRNA synthetase